VHNLRSLYGSIAVLWYCPDGVSEVNYKAYIQGHRFVLSPDVEAGTPEDEVEQVRLHYGSHANYDDYKIATADGKLDGRHGIKLGHPGVTVLDFFKKDVPEVLEPATPGSMSSSGNGGRRSRSGSGSRSKKASENKTGFSTMKPTVQTKLWVVDEQTALGQRLHREVKDDEFIRRMLVAYLASGASVQGEEQRPELSLDHLEMAQETRDVLHQALALSGASDLLSFLLAAGEQQARQMVSQAKRHDSTRYASLPTSMSGDGSSAGRDPENGSVWHKGAIYGVV
jgi:hypothetical protein